jgi:rhamnosyl/mannosyltransferase
MVVTYHSDVVRQRTLGRLWAPLSRRVLDSADAIIVGSQVYAASSKLLAGRSVSVVPFGIEPAPFLASDRPAARSRFEVTGPAVIFVGRLRYYKGVDVLLEALAPLDDVTLLVVGIGPMESRLRKLAGELGMDSRVKWLGEVEPEELPSAYAAADVFCLPAVARSEAFGIVQLEAMASSLPVITTELGTATSWVTRHGKTGLVVPPRDPVALRTAILELLSNPATRTTFGAAGRARVLETFTADRMVAGVQAVYDSVVGEAA